MNTDDNLTRSELMKSCLRVDKRKTGFTSVEAMTSSVFVVVAVIFSLDCWFMISAARITDAACRDAAHAASLTFDTGNATIDSSNATSAAVAAVQTYAQCANSWMTAPNVNVTYNATATPPSVTVVTQMFVTPLVPLNFLGNTMNGVSFSQQYTFPLIKSMAGVGVTP